MTKELFNKLKLEDQALYLRVALEDEAQKTGITNALVFPDFTIVFLVGITGQLVSATAYYNPEEVKEENKKLLCGREHVLMNLDSLPAIKDALFKKWNKHNGLDN